MSKSKPAPYKPHSELEQYLGFSFRDKNILLHALTHKSSKLPYNNERLEFLGDAVLDLIVAEYLFEKFPHAKEGELSKLRACIVNEKGFMKLAQSIALGDYLLLSQSEENNKGRLKPSILSNAFEALCGAIYLESSLKFLRPFIYELLEANYTKIDLNSLFMDYKTALQELTQAKFGEVPEYVLLDERGPDHNKSFEISLHICGKEYARALGSSKKDAQQKSAKITYEQLLDSEISESSK